MSISSNAGARWWPYVAACGLQLFLVAITFPLSEIGSDTPLLHIDNAYHLYNITLAENLAKSGNINGYDPFFGAGAISGVFNYLSGRLPALLAALFSSSLDEVHLYKLYVFVAAVGAPLAILAAAEILLRSTAESLIAAILGIFIWWISYFHWYYTAGLVAYVASCYLGVLFVAFSVHYLEQGGGYWAPVAIGCLGAFGFFWHQLFPIPVGIAILVYLAINHRHAESRRLRNFLTIVPLLSLLPNLVWLIPTYLYFDQTYQAQFRAQSIVDANLIWQELMGTVRAEAHGSKLYPVLFFAALGAFAFARDVRVRRLCLTLLTSAIAIEVVAYTSSALPMLAYLQPNRFAPAGYLLLCIPAAHGIAAIATSVFRRIPVRSRALALFAAAAMVGAAAILSRELWREVTPGPQGRYGSAPPQVAPLGPYSTWALTWLNRRTSPDARVLFETSLSRVYDGAHIAGEFALQTNREFIGGPYPFMYFAGFWDGWVFGRPISEIPFNVMMRYLSLYNIGGILVYSDPAKRYFDAMPGVALDAEKFDLRAYRVNSLPSYFVRGAGRVESREHNSVIISDVTGPEIVLKYHFVPGLTTDPPTTIDGIRLMDDPIPFVRIKDPPARLRLYIP